MVDSPNIAFALHDSAEGKTHGLEERSLYLSALRQKKRRQNMSSDKRQGTIDVQASAGGDGGLLDILAVKVSSITMMSREDVTATRNLVDSGLDSLVSVELRNWTNREYAVDLDLMQIVGAAKLQAVTDLVAARQKARNR